MLFMLKAYHNENKIIILVKILCGCIAPLFAFIYSAFHKLTPMKAIFPLIGFLGGISASLNSDMLNAFTKHLNDGTILREGQIRTLKDKLTNVLGSVYTEDFYSVDSDVGKKYENIKEAFYQGILSKKRNNFSLQKRIFKYGCLLFFKERIQEKKGKKEFTSLDTLTYQIIAGNLDKYKDRFFVTDSEVSDVINECTDDVDSGDSEKEVCYENNVKKILSYYLRVLSRLSGGMEKRFVYFQTLEKDIVSILENMSIGDKLCQNIHDVFLKLDTAAKACIGCSQKESSVALKNFNLLAENSIKLLEEYKVTALKGCKEYIAAKIKESFDNAQTRATLASYKPDELKLINLFNLAISTITFSSMKTPSISVLKSFSFDLLSYYMYEAIDYHYIDNLKLCVIGKKPEIIDSAALDKALSEVFWDNNHRTNNVSSFRINDSDLFSVASAPKDPKPEDKTVLENAAKKFKDGIVYFVPRAKSWLESKINFNAEDEKLRKEREAAIKYINQKEDSFTTNEDLKTTHPYPQTREQRCYYTRHFRNQMKNKISRFTTAQTLYLEKYVDEIEVLIMNECVNILQTVNLGNNSKKLSRIASRVQYDKLDANKSYIEKIMDNKSIVDAFRFFRLRTAYESAIAEFYDKKPDCVRFSDLVKTMAAKNFIGILGSEDSRLQQIEFFWGSAMAVTFCISVFLGYLIYKTIFKKFKRKIRREKR